MDFLKVAKTAEGVAYSTDDVDNRVKVGMMVVWSGNGWSSRMWWWRGRISRARREVLEHL